jgi:SSS family solute:Na+ symporter
VKHLFPRRDEVFFLRFSRNSTVFWAAALVGVAWLTRHQPFVLNAAMEVRGLTSGALLGSLLLALLWRKVGPRAAVTGMLAAVTVMNLLYWPPRLPATKEWWQRTFHGDVFWPWFTLIGVAVALTTAFVTAGLFPSRPAAAARKVEDARAR